MPKIFGKVKVSINTGIATCSHCGFKWTLDKDSFKEAKLGHKITCPVCRVTKELVPGTKLKSYPDYVISTLVMEAPLADLSDSKYPEYELLVKNIKCKHKFRVKSRDLLDTFESGVCPVCKSSNKPDIIKVEQSTNKVKSEQNQTNCSSSKPKADSNESRSISREAKAAKALRKYLGKDTPIYKNFIEEIDEKNGECTVRCYECGLVRHVGFGAFTNARKDELTCPRCEENRRSGRKTIDNLTTLYCGKIYNGMRITKVYRENTRILCDLECLTYDKDNSHNITGARLSDVTSYKVFCEKCGSKSIGDTPRILSCIECRRMRNNLENRGIIRSGIGYNGNSGITNKDIYTNVDGTICDKCREKDTCPDVDSMFNQFSYIRELADLKDGFSATKKDVASKYPMIFGSAPDGAIVAIPNMQKGIIKFRDAYRGRDGQVYTFCKCAVHGTEMILSEQEIENFEHTRFCNESNKFSRFYNIDPKFLLKKKEKDKK